MQIARAERLTLCVGEVVPQVHVGLQRGQARDGVLGLDVPQAAVRRALIRGETQDRHRIVRRLQRVVRPLVVARRVARIHHRLRRAHLRRIGDHAARRVVVDLARGLEVGADVQLVVEEALVVVDADGQPLDPGAVHDTLLIEVPEGQAVVHGSPRARHGKVVLLADAGAVDLAEPVGIRVAQLVDVLGSVLLDGRPELGGVEHVGKACDGGRRHGSRVFDLRTLPPGLRGDENHTVRRVRAVERSRGRVLQDGDALDVVRIQEVKRIPPV